LKVPARLLACTITMAVTASRLFLAGLNPLAPLRQLTARRELLWQFTKRNFEQRHKGSYLGLSWAILNPLLLLGLYFLVFGYILNGRFRAAEGETHADFALALLVGLTIFHFLSEVINQSPTLIVANPNLVKKVVFPVEIIPVANLGASLANLLVCFALIFIGQAFFGSHGLGTDALWFPVLILPVILLGLGLGWLLAAVGVFLRDVTQTTQFASLVLMYVSAVFIPARLIQEVAALWSVLRFNPILQVIELTRGTLLWHQPMDFVSLGCLYAAGLAVFLLGHACFVTLRPTFADVL
jgi:lipopolysaccharide transport system permease protein